jgi:hypothetical protein
LAVLCDGTAALIVTGLACQPSYKMALFVFLHLLHLVYYGDLERQALEYTPSHPGCFTNKYYVACLSSYSPFAFTLSCLLNTSMGAQPLPPAVRNDEQYWVKPILCEETRARLEHFRKLGWLPPNYKPKTLMGIAEVERYWRRCVPLRQYR